MANIEALTVMAIIQAQDEASSILDRIFGSISNLTNAFVDAGEAADASSKLQAQGMLVGDTAAERLTYAQAQLADAQIADIDTAMRLMDAQDALAESYDASGAATAATTAALGRLAAVEADVTLATAHLADAQEALGVAQDQVKANTAANTALLGAAADGMIAVGAATAVTAGYSVDLAAKFQQQTQVLVSGAGVSQNQINAVRQSILNLSVSTGTSTTDLTNAFFQVNSRLGNVAQSTQVVSDASELAKVHMADLGTVATALANTLNAYKGTGLTAAQASNILGTAVEKGGMSFQDLAGSLSTILPIASSMHLSLAQMTGALATMTTQGMSTAQATTYLSHTIQKLSSPTATMLSTWNQLGVTQGQVAKSLAGPGGLQAAMDDVTNAAEAHLGPAGQVVISTFKQSSDASNAMTQMLNHMTPAAKSLAQQLQAGTIGQYAFTQSARALSEQSAVQDQQFLALSKKASGFNDALTAGKPGFANFDALLKSAYGDQTSLNTALMLGGAHAQTWSSITAQAAASAKTAGSGVEGWSATQDTLNFKLSQAKEALNKVGIELGTALIPLVTSIISKISPWISGLSHLISDHQSLTRDLVLAGLALGAMGVALKIVLGLYEMFSKTAAMITGIREAIEAWQIQTKLAAAATAIWEGIQAAFNAVMALDPIVLVIIAIVALVAIVVVMYERFKWFHDFIQTVWSGLKEGATATWHALETAFHAIMSVVSTVGNFISSKFSELMSYLSGIWHDISNTVSTVWNGISAFFEKWWPLLLVIFAAPIAILIAVWNHFHSAIMDTVKTVWGWIKDFLNLIWDAIKIGAEAAWLYIKYTIITPMELLWDALEIGWKYLSKAVQVVWNALGTAANWAWNEIKKYIISPVNDVLNFLGHFGDEIWDTISKAFDKVMNFLAPVGTWFEKIGTEIVNGIIKGVSDAGSYLMNEMSNLANDALNSAKSFLGISSPSRKAADQIGQWIPHGVAQGVTEHTSVAVEAVKQMAGKLPAAIGVKGALNLGVNGLNSAGSVVGTGIGLGVGAAGGAGQGMQVTLDMRGAIVAGDAGMTQLTNKIGAVLAKQILPQAGVRIR